MVSDVLRTDRVLPTDGTPVSARVQHLRETVRRRVWGSRLLLPGSIPLHGLCAIDVPRESAQHRNVLAFAPSQALSRRLSRTDRAEHARRCKSVARLADLCRFRPGLDRSGSAPLRGRRLRLDLGADRLRTRLDDHRPLPVAVPVGAVSTSQGGRQAPHVDRSARQYPHFRPRLLGQAARRDGPRTSCLSKRARFM